MSRFYIAFLLLFLSGQCLSHSTCGLNVHDVQLWLSSIGLPQYIDRFAEEHVTGCDLMAANHETLQYNLGVLPFGDRSMMLRMALTLRDPAHFKHDLHPMDMNSALKLQLVCGPQLGLHTGGWRSIDVCTGTMAVPGTHSLNLNFPSESVQHVRASSVLQHYSHRLVNLALAEWWRVLVVGGTLEITGLPNLRHIASAFVHGLIDIATANLATFGHASNSNGTDFNFVGFDVESLTQRLEQMGFSIKSIEFIDWSLSPHLTLFRVIARREEQIPQVIGQEREISLMYYPTTPARGILPSPLPSPLLLNLGCGNDVRDGFVNIDMFASSDRVVLGDVFHLDFSDGVVDYIVASDILEHFSHHRSTELLTEWARVLRPYGVLEVRTPEFGLHLGAYHARRWDAVHASVMIYAGQTNPGDFHMVGFDRATLAAKLRAVGLEVIEHGDDGPSGLYQLPSGQIIAGHINQHVKARKLPKPE